VEICHKVELEIGHNLALDVGHNVALKSGRNGSSDRKATRGYVVFA
jgi:hypothetical protein